MAVEASNILSEKKERREKGREERGVRAEEKDKVRVGEYCSSETNPVTKESGTHHGSVLWESKLMTFDVITGHAKRYVHM